MRAKQGGGASASSAMIDGDEPTSSEQDPVVAGGMARANLCTDPITSGVALRAKEVVTTGASNSVAGQVDAGVSEVLDPRLLPSTCTVTVQSLLAMVRPDRGLGMIQDAIKHAVAHFQSNPGASGGGLPVDLDVLDSASSVTG